MVFKGPNWLRFAKSSIPGVTSVLRFHPPIGFELQFNRIGFELQDAGPKPTRQSGFE